ncbi:glycosyltransferase family 1 protein [Rhodoferax lacus]|uniref:Glycosyltransferase family 1 protein n=1 Tax=Rhodoferax lacus TaxID=2184758 RepID=A0A3E1R9B0_9BURK|nr:glycosyltransferase [Rhodoferax lacus]RFO95801.1 glycosyltransferase family 1 protein [Rhodoferax lacus]
MMAALEILYLGPESGTCLDRAHALRRRGHTVAHWDLRKLLPTTPWVDRITWRLGGDWLAKFLLPKLDALLDKKQFDICYVDGGEYVTPKVLELIRRHARKIISYSIDDPLGPRDGARFRAFRQSLPLYDLNAVVRTDNVLEGEDLGARQMLRVYRSADEVSHAPRHLSEHDHLVWDCDVLFLGTWFPERGPFLKALIDLGVPLTIQGPHWHKAREWPVLKSHWRGGAIAGDDYAKAIQCAKVNLGLLSRENRDLHTTRSLEIPALGALLCAERTSEHMAMYDEGHEALFWDNAQECAEMCRYALVNEERRAAMAAAGHQRVMRNGHYNEMIVTSILAHASLH